MLPQDPLSVSARIDPSIYGPNMLSAFETEPSDAISAFKQFNLLDNQISKTDLDDPIFHSNADDFLVNTSTSLIEAEVTQHTPSFLKRILRMETAPLVGQHALMLAGMGFFKNPLSAHVGFLIQGYFESLLTPSLLADNGAYGLIMNMAANRRAIQELATKLPSLKGDLLIIRAAGDATPFVAFYGIDHARALIAGDWPNDFSNKGGTPPYWQLPYNAFVMRSILEAITRKYFVFDSVAGWTPTRAMTNPLTGQFISAFPSWFRNHDYGLFCLFVLGLANGEGGAFTSMKGAWRKWMIYPPNEKDMFRRFVMFDKLRSTDAIIASYSQLSLFDLAPTQAKQLMKSVSDEYGHLLNNDVVQQLIKMIVK